MSSPHQTNIVIPPKEGTLEAQLLALLESGKFLSDIDILKALHTNRSSSLVQRLRRRGYEIVTILRPQENRRGQYGVYFLPSAQPFGKALVAAGRLRWQG